MKSSPLNPERVTVYITKYWASKGILVAEAEIDGPMVIVPVDGSRHYYHGQDWHKTFAAARERVLVLAAAKKKSLQKALDEMDQKVANIEQAPVRYPRT